MEPLPPDQLPRRVRVLVGDSVYESAQVTIRDGVLYIEFEDDNLDSLALDLRDV